jgi:hypothetical protein
LENRLSHNVALIVGARGVIVGNLLDHLQTLDDWSVIGPSSRWRPDCNT